jgi:hypothetical protein
MSFVAVDHSGETFQVPLERLLSQCELFSDLALLAAPYTIRSSVSLAVFQDCLAALNKETFELTNDNVGGLSLLCAEFRFRALAARLSEFKASPAFRAVRARENAHARLRIAAPVPPFPPLVRFGSVIVSDFPEIFAEFRGKRFSLLWRGTRDGVGALDFHNRCDGHANALTLILDTKRNVFGGFTPVEWDSSNSLKADDSLRSFLFTLKNPHNIPARRFALKAERKGEAISCSSMCGLYFGGDICVFENCSTHTGS